MKSETFNKLFYSIKLNMRKIEESNKKYFEGLTKDYVMGQLVGKLLIQRIPQLSIDGLSNPTHYVTYGERKLHDKLENEWFYCEDLTKRDELWIKLREYSEELRKKYLPKTYVRDFPFLNYSNEKNFKKGIIDELWDYDFCNYNLNPETIIIENDSKIGLSRITLSLKIEK